MEMSPEGPFLFINPVPMVHLRQNRFTTQQVFTIITVYIWWFGLLVYLNYNRLRAYFKKESG